MPKTLANPTKFTSLHSCLPCALRNELTLCYFFLPTAGDFGQISLSPQFTNGNMLPLIPYPWVKQQVLAGPVQLGPIRNKSLVLLHVSNPAWLTAWRTLGNFTEATICGCRFQSRFYQCNSCEHHNKVSNQPESTRTKGLDTSLTVKSPELATENLYNKERCFGHLKTKMIPHWLLGSNSGSHWLTGLFISHWLPASGSHQLSHSCYVNLHHHWTFSWFGTSSTSPHVVQFCTQDLLFFSCIYGTPLTYVLTTEGTVKVCASHSYQLPHFQSNVMHESQSLCSPKFMDMASASCIARADSI